MIFDAYFVADGYGTGVLLWADEPKYQRVRFFFDHEILTDVLGGGNPVHHDRNNELCNSQRKKIEAACHVAFSRRPDKRVSISILDFKL